MALSRAELADRLATGVCVLDGAIGTELERRGVPTGLPLWSAPALRDHPDVVEAIHREYPNQLLAYNCSPSFNWRSNLDDATIAKFQRELGAMGYKFQFITLAGFHALNFSMFELARGYAQGGMSAYADLQEREFDAARSVGYRATTHQKFVGTGYFDAVSDVVTGGAAEISAMAGSTEEEQF